MESTDTVGYIELGFYEARRGGRRLVCYEVREGEREVLLTIPSGAEDGDRIPIEGDSGAFVALRVGPQPTDSTLVKAVAAAGLLAALGFLAFLFLG